MSIWGLLLCRDLPSCYFLLSKLLDTGAHHFMSIIENRVDVLSSGAFGLLKAYMSRPVPLSAMLICILSLKQVSIASLPTRRSKLTAKIVLSLFYLLLPKKSWNNIYLLTCRQPYHHCPPTTILAANVYIYCCIGFQSWFSDFFCYGIDHLCCEERWKLSMLTEILHEGKHMFGGLFS